MPFDSGMYICWYADNIWLFVPIQQKVKAFLVFQESSSLNAANINHMTLKAAEALKRLHEIESLSTPSN
jgi:arylsulfatase